MGTTWAGASKTSPRPLELKSGVGQAPLNDAEILRNLHDRRGLRSVDCGAGGDCLFLSIADQVLPADVATLHERSPEWAAALGGPGLGDGWEALSRQQRAKILRRTAMLAERDFAADLRAWRSRGDPVPPEIDARARELFKDMAEEFISSGIAGDLAGGASPWDLSSVYARVRALALETPAAEVQEFVVANAEKYMEITGRDGNWAGSSEMVALAGALGRDVHAYGNDWVSQDAVGVRAVGGEGDWEVLPYFSWPRAGMAPAPDIDQSEHGGALPVRVFQCSGGGHYCALLRA